MKIVAFLFSMQLSIVYAATIWEVQKNLWIIFPDATDDLVFVEPKNLNVSEIKKIEEVDNLSEGIYKDGFGDLSRFLADTNKGFIVFDISRSTLKISIIDSPFCIYVD